MKLRNITAMILALAGTAMISQSAQAYTAGDLILGFEKSGSTSDITIDLGNAASFINGTASGTLSLNLVNNGLASDISTTFSDVNWATDGTIQWGIAGGTNVSGASGVAGAVAGTVFFTSGEFGGGSQSSPLNPNSLAQQASQISAINNIGFASGVSQVASTKTANGFIQSGAPGGNTFASAGGLGGGFNGSSPDFRSGNIITTTTDDVLDLYQLAPGAANATFLGSLSIDATSGSITFTSANPAAAPEPSTYALIVLGAGVLFWQVRRRNALLS